MATAKLVAGATSSFTAAITTTVLDSLASNKAILSDTTISNGTNLDLYLELSFIGGGSITPTGAPYLGFYMYPSLDNGSDWGDGRFASAADGPPPQNYWVGNMGLFASAGTQKGYLKGITMPRRDFRLVIHNVSGVSLSSSGNTLKFITTNYAIS
jgi:hypothetical protein